MAGVFFFFQKEKVRRDSIEYSVIVTLAFCTGATRHCQRHAYAPIFSSFPLSLHFAFSFSPLLSSSHPLVFRPFSGSRLSLSFRPSLSPSPAPVLFRLTRRAVQACAVDTKTRSLSPSVVHTNQVFGIRQPIKSKKWRKNDSASGDKP